jgi:hypothetical protein
LKIDKCLVDNCYTGIEASGGDVIGNTILECVYTGVLFGGGAGSSLRQIKDNIVNDIQGTGYSLEYSLSGSVVQDLIITGNQALTCEGPGFACSKLDSFVFTDNFARNVNTGATPNRAFIFTQCTNGFVHQNFVGSPNGTNTTGVVELASCTQVLRGVNRGVVPITGDVTGAFEMQLTSASAPSYEHDGMTLHTTDGLTLKFRDKNGNVRTITHT